MSPALRLLIEIVTKRNLYVKQFNGKLRRAARSMDKAEAAFKPTQKEIEKRVAATREKVLKGLSLPDPTHPSYAEDRASEAQKVRKKRRFWQSSAKKLGGRDETNPAYEYARAYRSNHLRAKRRWSDGGTIDKMAWRDMELPLRTLRDALRGKKAAETKPINPNIPFGSIPNKDKPKRIKARTSYPTGGLTVGVSKDGIMLAGGGKSSALPPRIASKLATFIRSAAEGKLALAGEHDFGDFTARVAKSGHIVFQRGNERWQIPIEKAQTGIAQKIATLTKSKGPKVSTRGMIGKIREAMKVSGFRNNKIDENRFVGLIQAELRRKYPHLQKLPVGSSTLKSLIDHLTSQGVSPGEISDITSEIAERHAR